MTIDNDPLARKINYMQVQQVVHAFYKKLRKHSQLGPFFAHIDNFSHHEKRITDFWWMSLGGKLEQPPKIDMIGKHFPLGIRADDLELWLILFRNTLEEQLPEDIAAQWMHKAMQIAARIKQIVIDHKPMGIQIRE
ncbi:MAG: group III truncated hemoglobin [Gammaproteobacteria bacterium]|nr:MAG: group III truncated hemoglobin [Gammaproteobacteria bacterium]